MERIPGGARSRLRKVHSTAMKLGRRRGTFCGILLCRKLPGRRFERPVISVRSCGAYADTIWLKPAWKPPYGISKRRSKTCLFGKCLADHTKADRKSVV